MLFCIPADRYEETNQSYKAGTNKRERRKENKQIKRV